MPAMSDEARALREANDSFYRALETLDLPAMEALWSHEDWVRCIHPGQEVIVGWPEIRRSWEQIFASTRWIRVTTTAVAVQLLGPVALVACSENITAANESDVGLAVAQATNLFQRTPDGWRLVVHHASPAPVQLTSPETGSA
jgi:ketosteroid isomerase-like protein